MTRVNPLKPGGISGIVSTGLGPVTSAMELQEKQRLLPIEEISSVGSFSIRVSLPPSTARCEYPISITSGTWMARYALDELRFTVRQFGGKMIGEPAEVLREMRLDGDADSWWAVTAEPKRKRKRSATGGCP